MRRFMLLALALAACDDSTAGRGDDGLDAAPAPDMAEAPPADAGPADDDALPPGWRRDAAPDPTGVPAYVEMALAPRQPLFTREEHPQATAVVYDRYGDVVEGARLSWDVQPPGAGTIDGAQRLTFQREGQGAVRACAGPDVCGRVSFFVDDAPPVLTVTSPERASLVVGDAPSITVRGTAVDSGDVRVFVNDEPVSRNAADGSFEHTLPATFGLNRIDVIADDGVRRPPARVVMEVLWAPQSLRADARGVDLPESVVVRLAQGLLDQGAQLPAPDEMGVLAVGDIAGLLEGFLSRAEPLGLVPDPVLAEGDPLSLRVTAIRPGTPDASLILSDDGLEAFLRLDNLEIDTQGALLVEGERFDLSGTVFVTAAAFARVRIEADAEGRPQLLLEDVGVAIENLGGRMDDSTAQAVLDTFGSLLRGVIERFAEDTVDDLISDQVPNFLEGTLDDALGVLRHIPLDVDEEPPVPPIHLDVGFVLGEPRPQARDALELGITGRIDQRMEVQPPHPDPGIPAEGLDEPPPYPAGAGLAIGARLVAVNALLHEVWRQGALRIDVTSVLPAQVMGLIREARVDGRLQPLVVATPPGSPYFFELQAGELDLFATSPRNAEPDHYVLSIRAGLTLEVGDGGIRFGIAEMPDIKAALVRAGGDRPILPPDTLGPLVAGIVWPKVQEAIGNGLSLPIDPIVVGPDVYGELAPSLQEIRVVPTFPVAPLVRRGWFVLSAGFEARLR